MNKFTKVFSPKVSIIIPVYNGSDYIRESIQGALNQTYKNLEIIVVNDGSTDGGKTEQVILSFGNKIKYYHKENGGVSSALNYGIEKMTGDYFSWLSHDDNYSPTKISDAVQLLGKYRNEKKIIAFTEGNYIDSHSNIIKAFPDKFVIEKIYSGTDILVYMLTKGTLNGCCMLIPKQAFEECGLFDEQLRYNQDALMWYKIFGSGYRLVSDNKKNVMYRIHEKQTSNTRSDLLQHDSFIVSRIILPFFANITIDKLNIIRLYALRNAKYCCNDAVNECINYGRKQKKLSFTDIIYIKLFLLYGNVRSIIKNMYYKYAFKISRK